MVTSEQVSYLQGKSKVLRHYIVDMIGHSTGKVGHLGGSSSCADIVSCLYFYKMNFDANNVKSGDRDRFLLSKGHAALVQYAALAEKGVFPKEELVKVKECGAMLQGHPDMNKTPGIEANTGSLGQGLSIGLGMALGLRMDKKTNRVYVIIGDGEIAEGQVWEAALAVPNFRLDNIVAIIDQNRIQAMGHVKDRMDSGDLASKWRAFGWHVIEIDGHSIAAICNALDEAENIKGQPVAIVAHTVKGKYVSFAENTAKFHNGSLTEEQFNQAHKEIDEYVAH